MIDSFDCGCPAQCDCADLADLEVITAWEQWDRDHQPARLRHLRVVESDAVVTDHSSGDAPGTVTHLTSLTPRQPRVERGGGFPESSNHPAPEAA